MADDGSLWSAEEPLTQDRLREPHRANQLIRANRLIRANQLISQQLELPLVLRRIAESAVELVDARYGALSVIAPDGSLEQVIHVGPGGAEAAGVWQLQEGRGLLGAAAAGPQPTRVRHLAGEAGQPGFSAEPFAVHSFLGVPVRIGNRVIGTLCLADAASGAFSADDEELVSALAATAGFAIDNARLYGRAKRREAYLAASAELTAALAGCAEDPLGLVAERVLDVSHADAVRVLLPCDDQAAMTVEHARGRGAEASLGARVTVADSVPGRVLHSGKPLLGGEEHPPNSTREPDVGPTMAVPLSATDTTAGVLAVSRVPGGAAFTREELELVADLAARAGVAIELAAARSHSQRMALLEERGRIARDLHDHVIQQLFATGLELQSIAGALPPGADSERLERAVAHIDESIGQIRTSIFALSPRSRAGQATLRHRIIDLLGELDSSLAHKPRLSFEGPVDLVIVGGLADDALAVVREALSNTARHAAATRVSLVVAIKHSRVEIDVENDGAGAGAQSARRGGLENIRERATRRGGVATFETAGGRARLHWQVPVGEGRDGW